MATSVKMDERTKDRLERLQAEIKLQTGTKVSQQELLERLVDEAFASRGEFIDSFRDEWDGLTEEEIDRLVSGSAPSGDPVDEDGIDEALYDSEIE